MTHRIISILILLLWMFCAVSLSAQHQNSVEGDLQALTDLYHATGGDNWKNNSGWLEGDPSNSWYGIRVDRSGRVIQIRLQGNNLNGSLPSSLGNLSRVAYFNVKKNRLTGEIPSSIGNMRNLVYLLLNGRNSDPDIRTDHHPGKSNNTAVEERTNQFTGRIPSGIGNLSKLLFLELMGKPDSDGLTGEIPETIGNLGNLQGIFLNGHQLNRLPSSFGRLTQLRHINLSDNDLNGEFPPEIRQLVHLRYIRISSAGLYGQLPDVSEMSDLRIFLVRRNKFDGSIPSTLLDGTIPNLHTVDLAFNDLSGELPEIGANLTVLTIDGNRVSGKLPHSISNAVRMINLGLGWNDFEGEIPDLSRMHQLRYIRVQSNNFTGTLPAVNTRNNSLRHFYYQHNNLSGYIDPALADVVDLPNFQTFNISNNKFSMSDIKDLKEALDTKGKLSILEYEGQNPEVANSVQKSEAYY